MGRLARIRTHSYSSIVIALLLALSAPASADEVDQATFDRVAGPWVKELVDCGKSKAEALKSQVGDLYALADQAVAACDAEYKRLEHVFLRPPFNDTQAQAAEIAGRSVEALKARIIQSLGGS